MEQAVQPGDLLAGKYRVERVLGQGGMGVVVAATHEQLDQRVALKFLLPEAASSGESVARFLKEARATVKLKSEHVARVLDVGTLPEGAPYIVMEYLAGQDLHAVLKERGQLPLDLAIEYLLQACEALAEAHRLGIVHRDLKPANLFLTTLPDGGPCIKILDFGISKMTEELDLPAMTRTGALLGTPYYMPPEQLRSSRAADPRSDLWALGVIFYELLTGEPAFPGETLPELCAAILTDPVRPLSTLRPSLPHELDAIAAKCLEKDPAARYQDVAQLAAALARVHPAGAPHAARIARISRHESRSDPAVSSRSTPDASPLGPADLALATLAPAAANLPAAALSVVGSGPLSQSVHSAPAARPARWLALAAAALIFGAGLLTLAWRTPGAPSAAPEPATSPSAAALLGTATEPATSPLPLVLPAASATPAASPAPVPSATTTAAAGTTGTTGTTTAAATTLAAGGHATPSPGRPKPQHAGGAGGLDFGSRK